MTPRLGLAGRLAATFIPSKLTPLLVLGSMALGAFAVASLLAHDVQWTREGEWAANAAAQLVASAASGLDEDAGPHLETGSTLGPYSILDVVGAGAMGRVYRARDVRLNRDVAIKTILKDPAQETDPFARLHREAQTLGSLNDPNIGGIYELPFGKGRTLFADVNKVASYVISGWQISGVYQYQSGGLLGFNNLFFNGNIGDIALDSDERTLERWFNTAGFVRTAPSNNLRTFPFRVSNVRANAINNVDLSVIKKTEILENKNVEFRAEFLNAFNHPLFPVGNGTANGIITDVTSASLGSIITSNQANYARRIQMTLKLVF